MLSLLQQSTAVLSSLMTCWPHAHSCLCKHLKLDLSLLLSQAAFAQSERGNKYMDGLQVTSPKACCPVQEPQALLCPWYGSVCLSSLWPSFVSCLCTPCLPSDVWCRCLVCHLRIFRTSCVGMLHHSLLEAPTEVLSHDSVAQHTLTTLTSQDHQACRWSVP